MKRVGAPAMSKARYPVFAQAASMPVRFCNACTHSLNKAVCMCCPLFVGFSPDGAQLVLKKEYKGKKLMELQKRIETTDLDIKSIFEEPEEVLRILGPEKALQAIKKLSVSPELEAELKECRLMKLIESGVKYVTGQIIKPPKEDAGNA